MNNEYNNGLHYKKAYIVFIGNKFLKTYFSNEDSLKNRIFFVRIRKRTFKSQPGNTCSKSILETVEKGVK